MRPAPRWAVTTLGLLLAGTLAGGVTATVTLRGSASSGRAAVRADVAHGTDDAERTAQVQALLDVRARALQAKDVDAFVATVDPAATSFAARQRAYATNLAQVPLTAVSYDLDARTVRSPAKNRLAAGLPSWSPAVTLRYELTGFDATPTSTVQTPTFVQRDGRWYVAADDDDPAAAAATPKELWDFGPVVVTRGQRTLVLSHADHAAQAADLAQQADAAVGPVTAFWGTGWAQTAVLQVPSDLTELSAVTGATGDLTGFAALQSSETQGTAKAAGGDRITVNPVGFFGSAVSSLGRQVVLRHEITHVASRRVTGSATPVWLAEGLADDVGFTGSGLSPAQIAQELVADVRAGMPVAGLPVDGEFRSGNTRIQQAYEQSWAFCSYLSQRYGTGKLVAFYTAVGTSTAGTDAALAAAAQSVLGASFADVRAAWLAQVTTQLGA